MFIMLVILTPPEKKVKILENFENFDTLFPFLTPCYCFCPNGVAQDPRFFFGVYKMNCELLDFIESYQQILLTSQHCNIE